MTLREYHLTPVGSKVIAHIGRHEHVAKVVGKNGRQFHLNFRLKSGVRRTARRSASQCRGNLPRATSLGPTRGLIPG